MHQPGHRRDPSPLKDLCPDMGGLPAAVSHGVLMTGCMSLEGAGLAAATPHRGLCTGSQDQYVAHASPWDQGRARLGTWGSVPFRVLQASHCGEVGVTPVCRAAGGGPQHLIHGGLWLSSVVLCVGRSYSQVITPSSVVLCCSLAQVRVESGEALGSSWTNTFSERQTWLCAAWTQGLVTRGQAVDPVEHRAAPFPGQARVSAQGWVRWISLLPMVLYSVQHAWWGCSWV